MNNEVLSPTDESGSTIKSGPEILGVEPPITPPDKVADGRYVRLPSGALVGPHHSSQTLRSTPHNPGDSSPPIRTFRP